MNLSAIPLAHAHVRLEPTSADHKGGLIAAASDPSIWRHMPARAVKDGYAAWFDWLLEEQQAGRWLPFTVIAPNGEIVGQSSFINPRAADRGVEIGGTWYAPRAQGGAINPAAKYLLLGHAFDCGTERVELKTDCDNTRSRSAILKLGGVFEGVHRHHMLRADGSWRDTAWYSILKAEWPSVKTKLEGRLSTAPLLY
jgi:RimJ/RimL family protein N-acetyltransferase